MKTGLEILNELESLGAGTLLHKIGTPYVVAAGYFDRFPGHLADFLATACTVPDVFRAVPGNAGASFEVPEGYFDNFVLTLLDKIKEGANDDPVLSFPHTTVPYILEDDQYFRKFGTELLGLVREKEATIAVTSRSMPFGIEDGYFDEFPARVAEMAAELTAAPVLCTVGKVMPYALPEGYFEQEVKVSVAAGENKGVNVKPLVPRKRSVWSRWSIAAGVALVITLGLTFLGNKDSEGSGFQHESIDVLAAGISKESIDEYINVHLDEFVATKMMASMEQDRQLKKREKESKIQTIIKNITTEDIDTYLDIIE